MTGFNPGEPRGVDGRWIRLAGLLKSEGGFTFHTGTGNYAHKGFAVSVRGHEKVIPGYARPDQIGAYIHEHGAALSKPGNHLGGWYNTEDGKTYLDVSQVFSGKDDAMKTATERGELAIFDLATGEEHRTGITEKKHMNLAFQTPFVVDSDLDLSTRGGEIAFWKQILPKKVVHYTGKDGKRHTANFDEEYLTDLANNKAVDTLPFLLANGKNSHDVTSENWRGNVTELAVREDGLYGRIVFPNTEAAQVVLDHPDLAVSARIRENIEKSDGTTLNRGLIHVLGTMDPQVSGMSGWQRITDLSAEDQDVLDLTTEEYEDMGQRKPVNEVTEEDVEAMTDEEIDAFLADYAEQFENYDGEDEDDHHEAEARTPALAGAGADMSNDTHHDIELANTQTAEANARAREALRRVAAAEWEATKAGYLSEGVPPFALDLAAPVLNRPDDMVIDLSNEDAEDVNASKVVRGLLDALKGTVDLSAEAGHSGTFDLSNGEDPDKAMLDRWEAEQG